MTVRTTELASLVLCYCFIQGKENKGRTRDEIFGPVIKLSGKIVKICSKSN
jgi:hypothetical protein